MAFGGAATGAFADTREFSGHWAENVIDKNKEKGTVPFSL